LFITGIYKLYTILIEKLEGPTPALVDLMGRRYSQTSKGQLQLRPPKDWYSLDCPFRTLRWGQPNWKP